MNSTQDSAVIPVSASLRARGAGEVFVRVDDGDTRLAGSRDHRRERARHWKGTLRQLVSTGKLQIIDDVDQQQNDARAIRSVAVEVSHLGTATLGRTLLSGDLGS